MAAYTASQAAQRLHVKRPTVHMWHTRGWLDAQGERHHLTLVGFDANGARLYDENELLDAERDTRRKAQRSHRASRRLVPA